MQKKFNSNILKNQLFSKQDALLLAISGGSDSVVLAYLLKAGGFNFSMAHCNFKLRGKDSDEDEFFCKALAKEIDVKFYTKDLNVNAYCKKNKVSVQMAARELRYAWFNNLLKKNKLNYLVTAHHANDVVETVLINLCRGTGIKGLKGIPEKTGPLVRPLLNFTKEEIENFAKKEKIRYRTDKSNSEAKYERNFLRLNIIPKLKQLHPNLEQVFLNNASNFKEEAAVVSEFLEEKSKHIISKKGKQVLLDKNLLKKEKHIGILLHHIIGPLGFTPSQANDIKSNLVERGETGKLFFSTAFELTIDRNFIVIQPKTNKAGETVLIHSLAELKKTDQLKFESVKKITPLKKNELLIEESKLIFPLNMRSKRTGDTFKPFGMKGSKLLSDFLKDQKLNAFEKENCRILENGNGEIIWVMGHRSDSRYMVEANNTKLIKLSLLE